MLSRSVDQLGALLSSEFWGGAKFYPARCNCMTDLITIERVDYRQQETLILSAIDWRIEPGQHWAVLGPNGCGKTTLLKIACGYLWPTAGRVLRLGEELVDLIELRRSIGWVSSSMIADVPATDTALETVVTGRLGQVGLKRFPEFGPTDDDFAEAVAELERLNCGSLIEKPFGVLSQGERQQVLIARRRWPVRFSWCWMSRAREWTPVCAEIPGVARRATLPLRDADDDSCYASCRGNSTGDSEHAHSQ